MNTSGGFEFARLRTSKPARRNSAAICWESAVFSLQPCVSISTVAIYVRFYEGGWHLITKLLSQY